MVNEPSSASRDARLLAGWRRRLEQRRRLTELEVEIPGAPRAFHILAPADPDGVLDEMGASPAPAEGAPELHMPYWATPWPSGLALAELALARRSDLDGRKVIELGCGLGITAAAVTVAGADLAVSDCFRETLTFCQLNVLRNAGRKVTPILADWRTEEGRRRLCAAGGGRLVLAADVLYEKEDIEPLLALLGALVPRGGHVWLAEPGRATSTAFVERARAAGWRGETIEMERHWPATGGYARVRLHTLTPS